MTVRAPATITATLVTENQGAIQSGGADTEIKARTELSADATDFLLSWRRETRQRGGLAHGAAATRRIRRDFC